MKKIKTKISVAGIQEAGNLLLDSIYPDGIDSMLERRPALVP